MRKGKYYPLFTNSANVGGPLQVFRRQCYEGIGGYLPYGHEDTIAATMAQMHGWETRSFPDLIVEHHKSESSTGWRCGRAKFKLGAYDYIHGDTIIWEALRCIKEATESPYMLGSCLRFAAYLNAAVTVKKPLSDDFYRFVRAKQYRKLARAVFGRF